MRLLDQRPDLARHAVGRDRRQGRRAALLHLAAESHHRAQRARHRPDQRRGEQRQAEQQRQRGLPGDACRDAVAQRVVLGHLNEEPLVAVPVAVDAPARRTSGGVAQAALGGRQAPGRRIGRLQQQPAVRVPHLEHDPLAIGREGLGEVEMQLLELVRGLRRQQAGRLRQVRVQQRREFALRIAVDERRGAHPQYAGRAEQRQQQPSAQAGRGPRRRRAHGSPAGAAARGIR
ncbi:MAG: hypothetical protein U1F30_14965 [Steroidobacteraceae bacterium]